MRFWDASALTPLLVPEAASAAVRTLLATDSAVVAWWGTRVECTSALRRREREGMLSTPEVRRAQSRLDVLSDSWSEILPGDAVRTAAVADD